MAVSRRDDEDSDRDAEAELRQKIPLQDTRIGALLLILVEGFQGLVALVSVLPDTVRGLFRRGDDARDEEEAPRPRENPLTRLVALLHWLLLGNEEAMEERGQSARLIRMAMGIGGLLAVLGLVSTLIWGGTRLLTKRAAPDLPPPSAELPSSQEIADGTQSTPGAEVAVPMDGEKSGKRASGNEKGLQDKGGSASREAGSARKEETLAANERNAAQGQNAQEGSKEQAQGTDASQAQAEDTTGWDPVRLLVLSGLTVSKDIRGARRLYGTIINKSSRELLNVELSVHLPDSDGKDLAVIRINPLVASGGLFGDRAISLAPKQLRKFSMPLLQMPTGWNGKVTAEIASAEFKH